LPTAQSGFRYTLDFSDTKTLLEMELESYLGGPEVKGYPGDPNHDADGMCYYQDEEAA
jgi:hypothetical protein